MAYSRRYQIEFNHCDPAGIVFYPRYYEMLNSLVENFFKDVCERPFAQMMARGEATPTIRLDAVFPAPSRLGEVVEFTLHVTGLGRSSVDCRSILRGADGEVRAEFTHRLVWAEGLRSAPWPDDLRACLAGMMEQDSAG